MHYPFVNIHTHKSDHHDVFLFSHSLGEGYPVPEPPYTAGIHPWAVEKVDITVTLDQLKDANIVAIGEIGLDFAHDIGLDFAQKNTNRELQISVFRTQLKIAAERRLPVVIHCVKALDTTIEILREYQLSNVIFHSFIGNRQQAKQTIDLGYYISLGNISLSSSRTVDAMALIPLEKLFMETDADNITIEEIYDKTAKIYSISLSELKKHIYENYKNIFE